MTRQRVRTAKSVPEPQRFNLENFAAILPERRAIIGEDPGSWEAFHAGMRQSLNPGTPYEAVIAEDLIAIEWELLQHRSMRDAVLRQTIHRAIINAIANSEGDAGATADLADRAVSRDDAVRISAYEEIRNLGMEPIELMGEAYRGTLRTSNTSHFSEIPDPMDWAQYVASERIISDDSAHFHDEKIRQLERRRREVKRDYDQLQQSRPDEGQLIEQ